MGRMKILLISYFFGLLPRYTDYFLETCRYNPGIDWLLITDRDRPKRCPKNVKHVKMGLMEFKDLISKMMRVDVQLDRPIKLCDFRPMWGVVLDVDERRRRSPMQLYGELSDLVSRGLSEQRERLLDLIDKVCVAIVEESCPPHKLPEDWDWKGIHEGFREHFHAKLDSSIDELGDIEALVRIVYETAERVYLEKEKRIGIENMLRIFRHIYLVVGSSVSGFYNPKSHIINSQPKT